uniref:Uncharacterized protein n=1 Tax=Cacopsylla melanoneura TaxID=428564 RepID=A0A8D8WYP5_9HEMI
MSMVRGGCRTSGSSIASQAFCREIFLKKTLEKHRSKYLPITFGMQLNWFRLFSEHILAIIVSSESDSGYTGLVVLLFVSSHLMLVKLKSAAIIILAFEYLFNNFSIVSEKSKYRLSEEQGGK